MQQLGKYRPDPRHQAVFANAPGCIEVLLMFQDEIADDLWNHLENGISAQENEKASRFVFVEDKRACVAAHWLKRRMLSRADPSIEALSWEFEYGMHGKPLVAGRDDLHFNLSHCKGLVACALRRDGLVGIDVEFIGRPAPPEVVTHYFSSSEAAWWRAQPETMKTKAFFKTWTMKEALVKATGDGLSQPLRDFSVCVESLTLLPQGDFASETQSWSFHLAQPGDQHLLALAWQRGEVRNETLNVSVIQPDIWLRTMRK
jgi:4'-phosphopantetheinyl transferase